MFSGAPRAPGAAGRIRSGHAGQTRRQLQPLRLANLQHLPPLAGTGFAPGAGGGLGGRGLPQPAPPRPWRSLRPESHSEGGGRRVAASPGAVACPAPARLPKTPSGFRTDRARGPEGPFFAPEREPGAEGVGKA